MTGLKGVVVQSQIGHGAWTEVFQHNVRRLDEVECHFAALWAFEIEGDRAFVAVIHWEITGSRALQTARVVAVERFDFNDICT